MQALFNGRRVLENYDFEDQQNNNNSCVFRHFRAVMEIFVVSAKIKEVQFEELRAFYRQKASIDTLTEKVKPKVMEE